MADNYGQKGVSKLQGKHAGHSFQIEQALARHRTMMPVKVVAVHGGGTGGPPTVDVLPLVNQIDGIGNKQEHAIVYGIPCTRPGNASFQIIIDPKVDDIGVMSIADRDISSVKKTLDQANPGSFRRGSLSDGVYHGAPMGAKGSPSKYVKVDDDTVTIFNGDGSKIVMNSGGVTITAATVTISGDLVVKGEITATSDSTIFSTHVHSGIVPGSGNSLKPVPGS